MDGFSWVLESGEQVKILFSLIQKSEWLDEDQDAIILNYKDDDFYTVIYRFDFEDDDGNLTEYGQTLWPLLLQYSGLDAS